MSDPLVGDRIRLAFVGGALESAVGRAHRAAIGMDQLYDLVAGCFSRHAYRNRAAARQYGVEPARTCDSLEQLLQQERDRLDAVVILTPQDQHGSHVMQCIEAGVPVICEKALVASVADALAVRDLLAMKNGFLAVIYNYTGYPMVRELQRMIADGHLGRIRQVHLEMPQEGFARLAADGSPVVPQEWRLRDGAIPTLSLDLGVHLHMMVRFLTAERPLEVVATARSLGNFRQIVDNVSCIARFSGDLECNIWYSKTAFGCRNGLRLRVFGEQGAAEWVQENPEYLQVADSSGGRRIIDRAASGVVIASEQRYARFKAGHPAGFIEALANYYCDIAGPLRRVRDGDAAPAAGSHVFGIEESLEGLRFLEAIARSSASGRWETVQ